MSEPFDPYYQWLGIRPEEGPPDHYRLLGIQRFETDTNIIRAAAEQRFVYLRTFQLSPQASLAEMLLNAVAAAKVCLLDPQMKVRYDAGLDSGRVGRAERPLSVSASEHSVSDKPPKAGAASSISEETVPVGSVVPPPVREPWFHHLLQQLESHGVSWPLALGTGAVIASLLVVTGLLVGRLTHRGAVNRGVVQDRARTSTPGVNKSDEVGLQASAGKAVASSEAAPRTAKAAGHGLSTGRPELGQPTGISPRAMPSGAPPVQIAEGFSPGSESEARKSAVTAAQGERAAWKPDDPASRSAAQDSRKGVVEGGEILLPSGTSFRETTIAFDRDALSRLRADLAKKAGSVLVVPGSRHFGTAYAQYKSDSLDGVVVVCDRERREMLQVTCEHGSRQGWLVASNPAGQRMYACQYRYGTREGFGCLFDDDRLKMVVEYIKGRRGGLVIIAGSKIEKSFAKAEEAGSDQEGREALARMDELESQVEKTIDELQKRLKLALEQKDDEREEKERKAAAAARSVETRKKAQVTHEQLEMDRAAARRAQLKFHGLAP